MQKHDLKKLALMGLTGGVLLSAQGVMADEQASTTVAASYGANNGCGGANNGSVPTQVKILTEDQLLLQLNDEGKRVYLSLDPKGKALALKMANQSCKGQNDCKGQGSCKNADNACAGQNACKGKSPEGFRDKNQAVKAAAKVMANKRGQANGN